MARDADRARQAPDEAVDAIESEIHDDATSSTTSTDDADVTPAFELDLDPERQGSADEADENPD